MMDIPNVKDLSTIKYRCLYETRYRGRWVSISFCQTEVMPWRVSYAGNGHYFRSLDAAIGYATGRGFVQYHMMDNVISIITRKLEILGANNPN